MKLLFIISPCRYPDPLHHEIKGEIVKFRSIPQGAEIFLGIGSDEAIDILFRIFCRPGQDNIITTPPTYGMYKVCAKVNDIFVKSAPLTAEFDLDLSTIVRAIDQNTKMIFLCSPGNPTSKIIPLAKIEEVVNLFSSGIVVVDEAYIDFSPENSAVPLLSKYPNLVILQTLSKAFGLAGIRLGMAIASAEIIQLMNNVKAPYNINKLTAKIALEAFQPSGLETFQRNVNTLIQERDYLSEELQKLSVVRKVFPSDANFVLFSVPRSQEIYKTMADQGVVCRYR